jgi:hypothetical protein
VHVLPKVPSPAEKPAKREDEQAKRRKHAAVPDCEKLHGHFFSTGMFGLWDAFAL